MPTQIEQKQAMNFPDDLVEAVADAIAASPEHGTRSNKMGPESKRWEVFAHGNTDDAIATISAFRTFEEASAEAYRLDSTGRARAALTAAAPYIAQREAAALEQAAVRIENAGYVWNYTTQTASIIRALKPTS